MNRELVTSERLLEILNERLHQHDECKECKFHTAVTSLPHPRPDGCNWILERMSIRCSGPASNSCGGIADAILYEVSQQYNLET